MDDTWLTHGLNFITALKTQILVVKTQILVVFFSLIILPHIKGYTILLPEKTARAIPGTARELFSGFDAQCLEIKYPLLIVIPDLPQRKHHVS
ncbi:hypothetical protein [Flavihumibacter solisilvae]|uniref:Uncharacterized protein n=1 Tax=Flavihumibacter solisilvae TaxID=1349421 RepID=A0A0C1L2Z9_9BACT|nr:hypothetical protein [Flavihumibacter solisilvae]KIC93956.1 hypothetical protein OI18_12975 [Flavihumibacter solisilvae]